MAMYPISELKKLLISFFNNVYIFRGAKIQFFLRPPKFFHLHKLQERVSQDGPASLLVRRNS